MVDIVTNRIFDGFSRFSPKDNHQNESLTTISQLKRFSQINENRKRSILKDDFQVCTNFVYFLVNNLHFLFAIS